MRRQRNIALIKEHGKAKEKKLSETESDKLMDKMFKLMIIKMLTRFQKSGGTQ